ncbi:hypothetical protein SAMN04488511_119102 [Pedobacter suwonensis]|uniref:Uncharacterized protein n=1 Tax=Pedobacter suwonensis TaxID=332999 RepID=A0A1I0U353_9SPHI|nr:hypothetical protein SAMN04488511_119102 [Pedobacter suwonensis]
MSQVDLHSYSIILYSLVNLEYLHHISGGLGCTHIQYNGMRW